MALSTDDLKPRKTTKKVAKKATKKKATQPIPEGMVAVKFSQDHVTATHHYRAGKSYVVPSEVAQDMVEQETGTVESIQQ